MKLIDNPKRALTHFSTIALALSAGIVAMWATFPSDWLEFLPTAWVARGTGLLSLLGLVGKFIDQTPQHQRQTPQEAQNASASFISQIRDDK